MAIRIFIAEERDEALESCLEIDPEAFESFTEKYALVYKDQDRVEWPVEHHELLMGLISGQKIYELTVYDRPEMHDLFRQDPGCMEEEEGEPEQGDESFNRILQIMHSEVQRTREQISSGPQQ
jgi:hypothetical protein